MNEQKTREQWLMRAIKALTPLFTAHDYKIPEKLRASVGFPLGSRKIIGQAWNPKTSASGACEMFVSPVLADPVEVLGTLLHEMTHHVIGCDKQHDASFKRCALLVGLTGKMTATTCGPELAVKLQEISTRLGAYPHAMLTPSDKIKKQTTRLIKLQCLDCGMPLRTTRKWIDTYPTPWACPCGGELVAEEDTEDDG